MRLATGRLILTTVTAADGPALRRFHDKNAAHLAPWSPLQPPGYHGARAWQARVAEWEADGSHRRFLLRRQDGGEIAGFANFTNIVRGVFLACHLGYALGAAHEGEGLMHEALDVLIPQMFAAEGLHRIMASHLPENVRSARLLARLGFEREGYARSYLRIGGLWRDHVLTSRIDDQ